MTRGDLSLRAYTITTAPMRWWLRTRLQHRCQSPVTGLFLHRVADDFPNPWSIPTAGFHELLNWLQSHVDLVSIDEAQRLIENGNPGRMAVHLSFDDAYADNCVNAIPELLIRGIPFTYYVTTQNVQTGKPFPHDLKRGEPLAPNSIEEIVAMHDAGVEIGAHTRTHPDIGQLKHHSDVDLEIRGAREELASWIGKQPRHFAFPFGQVSNMPHRAIQYVYDQRFKSYCSAHGGYNWPLLGSSFHLRRFHGDPILARVKNWLSYDPRWVYSASEFEYTPFDRTQKSTTQLATNTSAR